MFRDNLLALPNGSFYCSHKGDKYFFTKQIIAKGRIVKIYSDQLKGNDIVSGKFSRKC